MPILLVRGQESSKICDLITEATSNLYCFCMRGLVAILPLQPLDMGKLLC